MKYTNYCKPFDFNQLSKSCNHYEAYFDEDDTSYITYIAAYFDTTLIGFISCITPDLSVTDEQQTCYVEITAMVHPNYRHQKIFSNLLSKLYIVIEDMSKQFNKKNNTDVSIQFICTVNDKKAKKHHLSLHSCDYLMILNDINVLEGQNLKLLSKDTKQPNNIKDDYRAYFSSDKSCYMLFYKNLSSPIAVCELEYFQSYTCISSVYVDSDKRGKKVGTYLITNLIQDYFKSSYKKRPLILHVSSTNPAAFQLYKNCGFSICEQVNYYYINTAIL